MVITKEELNNFMGSLHWIYEILIGGVLVIMPIVGIVVILILFFNSDIEYDVIDGNIPKGWGLHQVLDDGTFMIIRRTWG